MPQYPENLSSPIEALIFDMDGVIIDSNPMHVIAWRQYLASLGVHVEDLASRMIGRRNEELVADLLPGPVSAEEASRHGAAKEQLYREMMAPVFEEHLVTGIREFIRAARPMPMGLATNAEPLNMQFVLSRASLAPAFRVTLNGHQVANPKPDPEIYLRIADMLGVRPQSCVVFEDSQTGASAAREAGAMVVGVRTNYATFPGVDFSIAHFRDPALRPWLVERGARFAAHAS